MYNIDLGDGKMIYYSHFLTIKKAIAETKELYELKNLAYWIEDSIADKLLTDEEVEKLRRVYFIRKTRLERKPIGYSYLCYPGGKNVCNVEILKILKETDKAYFVLGYNDIRDYKLTIEEIRNKTKTYKKWVPKSITEFYDKDFLKKRKIGIE